MHFRDHEMIPIHSIIIVQYRSLHTIFCELDTYGMNGTNTMIRISAIYLAKRTKHAICDLIRLKYHRFWILLPIQSSAPVEYASGEVASFVASKVTFPTWYFYPLLGAQPIRIVYIIWNYKGKNALNSN